MARHLAALTLLLTALGSGSAAAQGPVAGQIGPALSATGNGRVLAPAGRMTVLGNFPSGGALAPDGRSYWAVDSGLGHNDVKVVDVATGEVRQTLPLPGAYGAVAFAPDGRRAYVSGEPKGDVPAEGPTKGAAGDVVHVFDVAPDGVATERDPIALPKSGNGHVWPIGLATTPDGKRLVAALNQANRVAIVDLGSRKATTVAVGTYPDQVAVTPDGRHALVTAEQDGTVDVVDLDAGRVVKRIPVGGGDGLGDSLSHPQGIVVDATRGRAYVAVASRDLVAVIDLAKLEVAQTVSLRRPQGLGVQPVALALAPDGRDLYVADSGEDAVADVRLAPTPRLVGRIPTAAYPTGVAVTPDGKRLVWLAAKGLGAGPNLAYGQFAFNFAAYGSYTPEALVGRLGVVKRPSRKGLPRLAARADQQVVPDGAVPAAPAGSPVVGPDGGVSDKIKHVFYVVRENRVYDQVFGTDPRGDGDPKLELFDDNGVAGPTGGVTPNAHALARTFPLIDHLYANSEVSIDGHIITSAAFAVDHVQRTLHQNYGNRGRVGDTTDLIGLPPMDSIFDQAARKHVSFRNFGESTGGAGPAQDDGRPTYAAVKDGTDPSYLFVDTDAGATLPGGLLAGATPGGHLDLFAQWFTGAVQRDAVPALTYVTLPIDHTLGTTPGIPTPKAFVADNDLALGQFVELISHSPIWKDSAIFVVEDDSQDGADHVDAHRMPAFVISPWARRGAVVHTRYDQTSVLHTIELMLGLQPLSLLDGMATPMWDAFDTTADVEGTRYRALVPTQPIKELNLPAAANGKLSARLPWTQQDLVPQAMSDRILWQSVHGAQSTPPPPGPGASILERERALGAMRVLRRGGDVRAWLRANAG